jgi:hypothetical protein
MLQTRNFLLLAAFIVQGYFTGRVHEQTTAAEKPPVWEDLPLVNHFVYTVRDLVSNMSIASIHSIKKGAAAPFFMANG